MRERIARRGGNYGEKTYRNLIILLLWSSPNLGGQWNSYASSGTETLVKYILSTLRGGM